MTLTRYLSQLMKEKGMRAAHVAKEAKLSPATLSLIKGGHRPNAETLTKILAALGYTQRDHQYLEAMSLWTVDNNSQIDTSKLALRISSAENTRDKSATKLIEQIVKVVQQMGAEDRANLLEAVRNPDAIRLWLESVAAMRKK